MKFLKYASLLGIVALASVIPAKADLIMPVTIASTSTNCVTSVGGMTGSLDLTSTGVNLDFGSPAAYGTTEPCGARLTGGVAAFNAGGPIVGTTFTYSGSICELQGASDGCNGLPGGTDVIQFTFVTASKVTISDVSNGGSFNLVLTAAPEPSTISLIAGSVLVGFGGLLRRRKQS